MIWGWVRGDLLEDLIDNKMVFWEDLDSLKPET